MTDFPGWEATERVLESGGFESRQRVLLAEPAVEPSETGARWLGITYWQAVDALHPRRCPRQLGGRGGRLRLLGGATLLRFGRPELEHTDGIVSCRYAIEGGLLALRAGGSVTLAQRPDDAGTNSVSPSRNTCRGWRRVSAHRGGRALCTRRARARSTPP